MMLELVETLRTIVIAEAPQMVSNLEQICNINSHSANFDGNVEMLKWFKTHFSRSGLTEGGFVYGHKDRPHLVMHNRRDGVRQPPFKVLLVGHTDTVYPIDHPFQRVRFDGEFAHGPGVSDMKGGLLVAAAAVFALKQAGLLNNIEITAFINSDEEVQSPTSRHLLEELCRNGQDIALVFEGGRKNGNVVKARKGVGKYLLRVTGKPAHAGINPQDGVNAIVELSDKLLQINRLNDYKRGITLTVGLVRGGVSRNTVAPEAEAEIDLRVVDPEDGRRVDAEVRSIANTPMLPGATTTVVGGLGRPPWAENPGSESLLTHFIAAANLVGQSLAGEATGGGSDGNFTAALGIPTLDALGPQGGNPHTPDEYIRVASLAERALLVAVALASLEYNDQAPARR